MADATHPDPDLTAPGETAQPSAIPVFAIPHVDAVGVLQVPEGYEVTPRKAPRLLRLLAGLLLAAFLAVTVITSAVSLGAYCLTSDGGDARVLRER